MDMFWAIQILKEVKNNKALHYLRCWQGPFHPTSQMFVYRKNAPLSPFKHGENNVLQPSNGGFASQHVHRRRLNHQKCWFATFFFVGLQTKPCLPWFFQFFPILHHLLQNLTCYSKPSPFGQSRKDHSGRFRGAPPSFLQLSNGGFRITMASPWLT